MMLKAACLVVALMAAVSAAVARPELLKAKLLGQDESPASFARWLAHNTTYGVISTHSHEFDFPFGNIFSFSDGPVDNSTGHLYFYASPLDASVKDLERDSRCSLTITQEDTGSCALDPEDPTCARLVFLGNMRNITESEHAFAKKAMFSRHPEMKHWSPGGTHQFRFMTLNIDKIWMVNHYGGAAHVDPAKYYAAEPKPPKPQQ